MLKKAGLLWGAAIVLLGLTVYLEGIIPRDTFGDMVPELEFIHSGIEHLVKLLGGVLIFSLLDAVLLPNLDIHKALAEKDVGATLLWGMIFVVVLYSFMVVV